MSSMSTQQMTEISKGARLAAALQAAIEIGDRERIESASRRFVYYLCQDVLRRVMQRWADRPTSWEDDYEWWEEGIEDAVVQRVVEGDFSPLNSWKHMDDNGEFDLVRTVVDDIWDQAVASWRIKGSEEELTRLHQRVVHIMT